MSNHSIGLGDTECSALLISSCRCACVRDLHAPQYLWSIVGAGPLWEPRDPTRHNPAKAHAVSQACLIQKLVQNLKLAVAQGPLALLANVVHIHG